jgi:hypothetical protein
MPVQELAVGVLRQALLDLNAPSPGIRQQARGWLMHAEANVRILVSRCRAESWCGPRWHAPSARG